MRILLSPRCAVGIAAAFTIVALLAGSAAGPPAASATAGGTLRGTVTVRGRPFAGADVALLGGSAGHVAQLGQGTTDSSGQFSISYSQSRNGILYVDATARAAPRLRLRAIVGVGDGGGVPAKTVASIHVNELTTVAAAYALAQFSGRDGVSGASPGLENAAATSFNLADPATGRLAAVVTNTDNDGANATEATLGTLANLVSLCGDGPTAPCNAFLRLATPPGSTAPGDTTAAVVSLARNPMLAPAALYALSRRATFYHPALGGPPDAWILVLLYTAPELYASGRIAIDAKGDLWSSVNWLPGTRTGSPYVTVLNPVGQPTLGSPITGGGMKGGAWGAAIAPADGSVWMGSFGGAAISQYASTGTPTSPSSGWKNGTPNHPQGVAIDQHGNVWIANNYGPESEPGQGDVIVYPHGDPSKAITITGGGLNHPFAVQIDGYGRAWVTNAGLGGAKLVGTKAAILVGKFGGSVTVINPDFKPASFSPIQSSSFRWPLGLAVDSHNNAWTANYFSSTVTEMRPNGTVAGTYHLPHATAPWSEAIDGSGRVWVAGFARPNLWLLCGARTSACPPGSTTGAVLSPRLGFRSPAFQHFTSVQIDQSGNVWLSNNWSKLAPVVGGTGIAEVVGAATPVCAPLQPLPAQPSTASSPACAAQVVAALPASLSEQGGGGSSSRMWAAPAAAVVLLAAVAGFVVRRRRAPTAESPR